MDADDAVLKDALASAPILRKYVGRPRAEVEAAARRYFMIGAVSMALGAALFVLAALGAVPGFGAAENLVLVLLSMVVFFLGIVAGNGWAVIDRGLHGERLSDRDWPKSRENRLALFLIQHSVLGAVAALVADFGRRDYSVPALLGAVGLLVAVFLLYVFHDARRRRRG